MRVSARWWRQSVKNQVSTNQNSRNIIIIVIIIIITIIIIIIMSNFYTG